MGGVALIPLAVAITAAFPTRARPAVFLTGLAGVAALCLVGGIAARRALLGGAATVRSGALAIAGLTIGAVAAFIVATAVATAIV